jgi:hypothetical protein
MVADAKCYINDRIYDVGEEFDYDGPIGNAFHVKGDKREGPVKSVERMLDDILNHPQLTIDAASTPKLKK